MYACVYYIDSQQGETHVMAISDICMNLDLIRLKEINLQMNQENKKKQR